MAAIDFPSSPSNGDTHTVNGVTYTYNSAETKWKTTINSNAFLPLTGGTVSGNIVLDGELQHSGDIDTNIAFDTDTILFDTAGSERFRVGSAGQLGIGGATYGTSGQVLTSGGASAAPQWADAAAGGKVVKTHVFTKTTEATDGVGGNSIGSHLMSTTYQMSDSSNSLLIRCAINISNTTGEDVGFVVGIGSTSSPTYIGTGTANASRTTAISAGGFTESAQNQLPTAMTTEFLYSPGNTNNNTYAIYGYNGYHGTGTIRLNANSNSTTSPICQSTMTFMEIAPN